MPEFRKHLLRPLTASLLAALSLVLLDAAAADAPAAHARTATHGRRAVRASKIYGWQPAGQQKMVLWLGVEEPYMIHLANPCDISVIQAPEWVSAQGSVIVAGVDAVGNGTNSCVIARIEPISRLQASALQLKLPTGRELPLKHHAIRTKRTQR